jgi:hypothetical protein
MGNNPIAETRERVPQTLSEEVQEKLKEIFAWPSLQHLLL